MKRFAQVAILLFVASVALAEPRARDPRDLPFFSKIVKKIARIVGITVNEDLPNPPRP